MSNYKAITITYSYTPDLGLKIGAGYGKYGIVDNAYRVRHDAQGNEKYTIPATTVKGKLRSNYNKILHLMKHDFEKEKELFFGISGKSGAFKFSDLVPADNVVKTGLHTSTAIDRFRRGAKTTSLHVEEYIQLEEGHSFTGEISGFISDNSEAAIPKSICYLLLVLLNTKHLGGSKTAGWGEGKISNLEVSIGNKTYNHSDLLKTIKDELEGE